MIRLSGHHPDHTEALNNKGIAYAALKKYEEALECFNAVLKLHPENELASLIRGITLAALKLSDEGNSIV